MFLNLSIQLLPLNRWPVEDVALENAPNLIEAERFVFDQCGGKLPSATSTDSIYLVEFVLVVF